MTARRMCLALAMAALHVAGACGGSTDTSPPPLAGPGAAQAQPGRAEVAPASRCPLTAEQVTGVVGAPMKGPDGSCGFFPADETKILPRALYVRQSTFACNGDLPAEIGYTETLEGLGTTAYVADMGDGTHLLVCRAGAPFEILVDLADNARARAAATVLARQVLGGA